MKIVLASNRNKAFVNTNYYREEALRRLGHDVVFFDVRQYLSPRKLRGAFPSIEWLEDRGINRALRGLCRREKAGMLLCVGGHSLFPATIRQLRAEGVRVVLWTSDIPYPQFFGRILDAAPFYERIFCAGTEALDVFRGRGITGAAWLPFACDPEQHRPLVLSQEEKARYAHDIVFVGSYYPHRRDVFEALQQEDVGIFGPLWDRLPKGCLLRAKVCGGAMDFSEWVKIYAAAKIVLAVHYQDGKTPCYQASPKLFEAMACGAFVLCDDQPDARALFRDGEHVVFFRNVRDLKEKARFYLEHPRERERIAQAGRQEVLSKHTYCHRMAVILRSLERDR